MRKGEFALPAKPILAFQEGAAFVFSAAVGEFCLSSSEDIVSDWILLDLPICCPKFLITF